MASINMKFPSPLSMIASAVQQENKQAERGKSRKDLVRYSVRPNGNSMVPDGNPSNPATRPYVILSAENEKDREGNDTRFLKVDALAYGERTYPMEVQEDLDTGKVWCHCGCPDFVYRFEVTDTNNGFSSIQSSNGAYPDKTNPMGVSSLCKHLESLLQDPMFEMAEEEWKETKEE